ncbi:MAG: SDR family oxidoreductase [Lachnospiraceae bacterium]|nr:SDR family oxidoreductase [Lachnospiraceae bacterium]
MSKVAMITGASRGIGEAIARRFAAAGFDLVLTCINNIERMERLGEELSVNNRVFVRCFKGDMGDEETVARIFDSIDGVDVLVNNAGISHVGLLQDMEADDWRRLMSTNLDSVFLTSKQAIKRMLYAHEGRIINISSMWGNVGASMEVAYSASKGGMNAFTKALAKELSPSNIQVNAIACGVIDTDMNSHLTDEEREELTSQIPAGRYGTPEEVAELAYMLAVAPAYLTGQIITMDGGFV